jgi:hypothetical protein
MYEVLIKIMKYFLVAQLYMQCFGELITFLENRISISFPMFLTLFTICFEIKIYLSY